MKLFKGLSQKRKQETEDLSIRKKIEQEVESRKQELSGFLSKQSERLSPRGKKILLLVFGIILGGAGLLLITQPFRHTTSTLSIASPPSEGPAIIILDHPEDLISHGDYQLLVGFRKTLDSLKLHDPYTYQSLLRERQGLIDSLDFLIRLYQDRGKALLEN